MITSTSGKLFIQDNEGLSLTPYIDESGTSIGYGHFYPSSTPASSIPQSITLQQAVTFFNADLAIAERTVTQSLTVSVPQQTYDGLVDYTYNRGSGNYLSSGVPQLINNGSLQAAISIVQNQYSDCAKSSLSKRRNKEAALMGGKATVIAETYSFPKA